MKAVAIVLAAMASAQPAAQFPVPGPSECRFLSGEALGCMDGAAHSGSNAVTLFENYGAKPGQLDQPYVAAYAHQFNCGLVRDGRYIEGRKLQVLGAYHATMPDGLYPVDRVAITGNAQAHIAWIDQRYLRGSCEPMPYGKESDQPPSAAAHD